MRQLGPDACISTNKYLLTESITSPPSGSNDLIFRNMPIPAQSPSSSGERILRLGDTAILKDEHVPHEPPSRAFPKKGRPFQLT